MFNAENLPCSENPELWLTNVKSKQAEAAAGCQTCPRILACLNEALATEALMGKSLIGVHGGLTPKQRTRTTLNLVA